MSRAPRLLALLQSLRRRRVPATAEDLAAEFGVSVRTLYRDVATLKAEGAPIAGEAGLGYVLRAGFFLPPLALAGDEVDVVMLGLRLVMARGDADLAGAAEEALGKVVAVLPAEAAAAVPAIPLLAGPRDGAPHLATLRHADWVGRGLAILQAPTAMDFGRTFTAADPDGHRLRVFTPSGE